MMKRLCYVLVVFALTLGWWQESMAETYSIQAVGKVVKRSGKTILEIFPASKMPFWGWTGFLIFRFTIGSIGMTRLIKERHCRVHPRGTSQTHSPECSPLGRRSGRISLDTLCAE